MGNLAQASPYQEPENTEAGSNFQRQKPECLVEDRPQCENRGRTNFVTNTIAVGCDYSKGVVPGTEIGVANRALVAGIPPGVVCALKSLTEAHAFRVAETESSIVKPHRARAFGKLDRTRALVGALIRNYGTNHDIRRNTVPD